MLLAVVDAHHRRSTGGRGALARWLGKLLVGLVLVGAGIVASQSPSDGPTCGPTQAVQSAPCVGGIR